MQKVLRKIANALRMIRSQGLWSFAKEAKARLARQFLTLQHRRDLQKIMTQFTARSSELSSFEPRSPALRSPELPASTPRRFVFVLHPTFAWNLPLFQRPQNLAKHLASEGHLYFFCSADPRRDQVSGFKQIEQNLFLTDRFDLLAEDFTSRHDSVLEPIYQFYATNLFLRWDDLNSLLNRGKKIVYEYVDEISELIAQQPIAPHVYERHQKALVDPRVLVVATAQRLYDETTQRLSDTSAKRLRNNTQRQFEHRNSASPHVILNPNGVDVSHFSNADSNPIPPILTSAIQDSDFVIGYFGALAKWVDYPLLKTLATEFPKARIVLIGQDYDGSLGASHLAQEPNVTIIPPINYRTLPSYAQVFDVGILPFVVNDVTLSTSPIKIFEYMALGIPIVSSDLPECRRYESVLVAQSHHDFVNKIRAALELRDSETYNLQLKLDAQNNTWAKRAQDIVAALRTREIVSTSAPSR